MTDLEKNNRDFKEFIWGSFNKNLFMAHKSFIKTEKGIFFSPFFIYSASGLGKTYYLNNLESHFLKEGKTVFFIRSNDFFTHVYNLFSAKKYREIEKIKEEADKKDILLIDDVQFLIGKTVALKLFFKIFDSFIEKDKKIVICSDTHTSELIGFEERILSRFKSSLKIEIVKLTKEDCRKFLNFFLAEQEIQLEEDYDGFDDFMLLHGSNSVRDLLGVIKKMIFVFNNFIKEKNLTVRKIYKENYGEVIKEFSFSDIEKSPEKIIDASANYFNVTREDILSSVRDRAFLYPRFVACYLMKNLLNMKNKEIAKKLNKKDSTISYILSKVSMMVRKKEGGIAEVIENIKKNLGIRPD